MTRRRSVVLCLLAMLPALAMTLPIPAHADDSGKVTVRCDKRKTIADALAQHQGGPLTIEVVGAWFEHVTVRRSDVTLVAGAPGAAIQGTDSTVDTLTVTADRFVLDGLSVSGGRNAIVVTGASQVQLRNCTTRGSGTGIVGGIGIFFSQGASGSVDRCVSSGNPADGIFLDGSSRKARLFGPSITKYPYFSATVGASPRSCPKKLCAFRPCSRTTAVGEVKARIAGIWARTRGASTDTYVGPCWARKLSTSSRWPGSHDESRNSTATATPVKRSWTLAR